MKRKHLKPHSEKSSDEKRAAFLETLIAKYFDRQSEKSHEYQLDDPAFNTKEIYNKVLAGIREKETGTRRWISAFRIAASVLLISSLASVLYLKKNNISKWLNPARMVEARAAKGQMIMVRLDDGTRIWLNSDSKLTYPKHFNGKKREIDLTGEAYFEVAHLPQKPFIIQSGDVKTVVLGTSFNIKAYPGNSKVEVTVLTGKVAVITPNREKEKPNTIYVTPDQKITYNRSDIQIRPYSVKAEESIGWKEGKMLYNGTPLIQVIEEVERKYNVKLNCSDKIKECTITADFNNERLDKVLKVMAKMLDGSVSYQNGSYYLDGKGCE